MVLIMEDFPDYMKNEKNHFEYPKGRLIMKYV